MDDGRDEVPLAPHLDEQGTGLNRLWMELAKRDLFHSFTLTSGNKPVAALLGHRYRDTFEVKHMWYNRSLASFSPGTTLWQMIIRDAIENQHFKMIHLGYGNANEKHCITNEVRNYARVLLVKKTLKNRLMRSVHGGLQSVKNFANWLFKCRYSRGN